MESLGSLRTASRVSDLASRDGFAALDPALREPTRRLVASRPAKNVGGIPRPNLQKVVDVTVAAVRQEGRLRLYLDGQLAGDTACASTGPFTQSAAVGVGCNPLYAGNECLPGRVAEFMLYARALSPEEVARQASAR